MLGKIQPKFFPPVFGPGGDAPLDDAVVRAKVRGPCRRDPPRHGRHPYARAGRGGLRGNRGGQHGEAIKKISVQRGHDVTEYTLCCFGGAAGQHACLVADALGMTRVFIHPLAGVLSAYGMGLADTTAMREEAVEVELEADKLAVLEARSRSCPGRAGGTDKPGRAAGALERRAPRASCVTTAPIRR